MHMIAAKISTRAVLLGEVYEAPTDGRLPMREDSIRDEITEEPQSVYTCHYLDCQRLTGTAFSLGIVVPETGFRLTGIEPRRLQRTADSGRVNTRLVCPDCGSSICGMPRNGVIRVRGGTLDDTSWLRPTRHIWTRRKQPWVVIPAGDEVFEGPPA